MQKFVRTVDTVSAFQFRKEQLLEEMDLNLQPLMKELNDLENEIDGLKKETSNTHYLIKFIYYILLAAFLFSIIGYFVSINDPYSMGEENIALGFGIVSGLFLISNILKRRAIKKKIAELLMLLNKLLSEREQLQSKIQHVRNEYLHKIEEQQNIYNEHMLNQVELLDQEVQAVDKLKQEHSTEYKECPQCAEFVKYKARKCRFCDYQFE